MLEWLRKWKLYWKTQSTQKVFSEGIKPMPYATTSPMLVIEELYKIISIQRHVTAMYGIAGHSGEHLLR